MKTPGVPIAGVIGDPIAHSRSPKLHGYWLRKYGIDGHYIPLRVVSSDLKLAFETLPKFGFVGFNVTLPHKEAVLKHADEVSRRAAVIGAANTVVFRSDGSIFADNTDAYGFIQSIKLGAPGWSAGSGPCTVLGSGGAARAVIFALRDAGATEIRLVNRTRSRAEALRDEFVGPISVFDWDDAASALEGAATVVNTTSLGMDGKPELDLPFEAIDPSAIVTDIVYSPLETKLLSEAKRIGCRTVDGLGMLLHQAAPGFESWFGLVPGVDDALRQVVQN